MAHRIECDADYLGARCICDNAGADRALNLEAELARYKAFADEVLEEAAVADLADVSAPTPEWAEAVYNAARKHLGDTATTNGGNGA